MTDFTFSIPERCPSIQGGNVGTRLREWRAAISANLGQRHFGQRIPNPDGDWRDLIVRHLNRPCLVEARFSLRATKHVTDIDRMVSFITACFRTELTDEAAAIEASLGTRPWFYYDALAFPANIELWKVTALRNDGQPRNETSVSISRIQPEGEQQADV